MIDQLSSDENTAAHDMNSLTIDNEEHILSLIKSKYSQVGCQTDVVLTYSEDSPIIYKAYGGKCVQYPVATLCPCDLISIVE